MRIRIHTYAPPNKTNHSGVTTRAWRVSVSRLSSTMMAAKNARHSQHIHTPPGIR